MPELPHSDAWGSLILERSVY